MTTKEENEKMLEFIEREEKPNNWSSTLTDMVPLMYSIAVGTAIIGSLNLNKEFPEYKKKKYKRLKSIKNQKTTV